MSYDTDTRDTRPARLNDRISLDESRGDRHGAPFHFVSPAPVTKKAPFDWLDAALLVLALAVGFFGTTFIAWVAHRVFA